MESLFSADFTEAFATPTREPQRSPETRPGQRHTGLCWFAGQGGYPDTEKLRECVRSASEPTDDTGGPATNDPAFARALASGFLSMSSGLVTGESEPQPYDAINTLWETVISTGPSQAVRRYLLESHDKALVFTGRVLTIE